MQEISANDYSVPGTPFLLSITTRARCYVVVKSLATGADLFARTIDGGVTQPVLVPTGSATLEAYAGGSSLSVDTHGKHVGTVPSLGYAVVYTFNPTNS